MKQIKTGDRVNNQGMEVIILNDNAGFSGGASSVALQSAVALANSHTEVLLFTAVGPVAKELENVQGLSIICLEQSEIADDKNRLRAFVQGIWNKEACRQFKAVLETKNPERTIIHAHMWMKALSPGILSVALDSGFKVAITLHDFFAVCPSGGFYLHKEQRICTKKPLSYSCLSCNCDRRAYAHKLWRYGRTAIQNKVMRVTKRVTHYIGVSQFSVDVMKPYLPDVPVSIVRNPVHCANRGAAPVQENASFLYIGRFVPEKGAMLFAEAAERLKIQAIFIGDGEEKDELKKRCPSGAFPGWLSSEDVVTALRSARALVFPSLWYETLGLTAIEALANGVPVIVSDSCAASEFVINDKTGLHFKNGSVESLIQKIERLQDESLAKQLGENAYKWYWDNPWTLEEHRNELMRVYRQILPGASGTPS